MVTNHHALRSRDNIYEYRDSPSTKTLASKAHTDTTSLRSPSSLAMTQKSSSQASLKSGISLKETNGHLVKQSERAATPRSQQNGSIAKVASPPVEEKRLLQPLSSTPVTQLQAEPAKRVPTAASVSGSSRSTTPVPSARSTTTHTTTATLSSQPAAQPRRTHLVEECLRHPYK